MTRNQRRALELASQIQEGDRAVDELSDGDWALLLLAAGLSGSCRPSPLVCSRIFNDFAHAAGYFKSAQFDRPGHHNIVLSEITDNQLCSAK
jgi:hypothetical protein